MRLPLGRTWRRGVLVKLLTTSTPSRGLELPSGALDATLSRAGTNALKWSKFEPEKLPMWVADMDLVCPEPVRAAVAKRATHGVYGYTVASPDLKNDIVDNVRAAWGAVEARPEWLRFHPGLISGLYHSARLVGREGAVIVPQPVYPPFFNAARDASNLLPVDSDDLADLERVVAANSHRPLVVLWCNPHNPTGRVWRRAELERLVRAATAPHVVAICSDEVWSGLVLDDLATPFVSLGQLAFETETPDAQALRKRLIVLTSPSKTYNVAALDVAFAVVPNDALRRRYVRAGRDQAECTPFGLAAAEQIFSHDTPGAPDILRPYHGRCEPWRAKLVSYLAANRDYAVDFIRTRCAPFVAVAAIPEASYLLWLDASLLADFPADYLRDDFDLALSDGGPFFAAKPDRRFVRLNFGCSRTTLEEGLRRLGAACDHAKNKNSAAKQK